MKLFAVYCSGSIKKGPADSGRLVWGDAELGDLAEAADEVGVVFLNPDDPIPGGARALAQFGRDLYQVAIADCVAVDARERRGVGVGVEMAAAAVFGTPVIAIAALNTKYRQDVLEYRGAVVRDYVHPHLDGLVRNLVETFGDAGRSINELARSASDVRKWSPVELFEAPLRAYSDEALAGDPPMLEALGRLGRSIDLDANCWRSSGSEVSAT